MTVVDLFLSVTAARLVSELTLEAYRDYKFARRKRAASAEVQRYMDQVKGMMQEADYAQTESHN